jgi:DNA-binding response OmpR family regulator
MKILIAEDDSYTASGLKEILEGESFTVKVCPDGVAALEVFEQFKPDLLLLDIMMPGKNGYEVLKAVRKRDEVVPVIFLSAKSEEIDKVLGLELGADDYISKPFGVKEVIARVKAVLRRSSHRGASGEYVLGDVRVVPHELSVYRGEMKISISGKDERILRLFADRKAQVISRDEIYDAGWGVSHLPNTRTLDQHISQLRKKIELDAKDPKIIITVHGEGYTTP